MSFFTSKPFIDFLDSNLEIKDGFWLLSSSYSIHKIITTPTIVITNVSFPIGYSVLLCESSLVSIIIKNRFNLIQDTILCLLLLKICLCIAVWWFYDRRQVVHSKAFGKVQSDPGKAYQSLPQALAYFRQDILNSITFQAMIYRIPKLR